jgi:hypothetical protein
MSNFVEQQNSNKHRYSYLKKKVDSLNQNIEHDIRSLKELIISIPNEIANNDKKNLEKAMNNLDLRIKLYVNKIDKGEYMLEEFKSTNIKFFKTFESMKSNNSGNAVLGEASEQFILIENGLQKAKETLNELEEILNSFKNKYSLDVEKNKISKYLNDKIPHIIDEVVKVLPSEKFLSNKIKEQFECVDGKCSILENNLKKLVTNIEKHVEDLEIKVENLEQNLQFIYQMSQNAVNNHENYTETFKDQIISIRHDLNSKLRAFEDNLLQNVIIKY